MGNPLCHFELMVKDVEKAKKFYGSLFDWKFNPSGIDGYTMIDSGQTPCGGLMEKPTEAPQCAFNCYIQVDDLDETLKKAESAGAKVVVPKSEIPNVGWHGLFVDPDGIAVGLFQPKADCSASK
mgnify:CR=1 FL=1